MVLGAVGLAGCGQLQTALGNRKNAPDEFQVVARAPLAIPPNYALRPPKPGADRPQEQSVTNSARRLVLPNAASGDAGSTTSGEALLRQQLGTGQAEPDIRAMVNRETANFVYEEEYFIDKLLFWKDPPVKGTVVDANAEKKRLQENSALGKAVTTGETPSIKRTRGGLLEGLFD
jgi:hypothetical protein